MDRNRKGHNKTREELLAAASQVFAENGYRNATIAEICRRAGANVAAVNYHFGNKENLYVETWRHSFHQSITRFPPDGGVSSGAPPEERFRGVVTSLLARIADRDNMEFLIVQKELANPTGLLVEVMRKALEPLRQNLLILIRDLVGPLVPDMQVRFCAASVISQCIGPIARLNRPAGREDKDIPLRIENIEAYARHVIAFSLAGMKAIRAETESNRVVS
ncbi:CerR family C-terminal domain-containing protein [bacterium]|nr:CerR family C-terminal domain-containing protein [bacterium]